MPDIITKHPDVVINILKNANIVCGENIKPSMLTSCPKDSFCTLPKGELCIYDVKDALHTSQITQLDLLSIPGLWLPLGLLLFMAFLAGLYAGTKLK